MKIFNDDVHGHITLHPLCCAIVDTPQFQRLRDIRQLGGVYYVFPGGSANRFEHCIGTCHLTQVFLNCLKSTQHEIPIEARFNAKDELCLLVAALTHDLGHGIWSHLFDQKFMPAAKPDSTWEHEHASIDILDYLLKDNKIDLAIYGLDNNDLQFIKELIVGSPKKANFKWIGRGLKTYLYDIVANKSCEIDTDKFDYFARDCKHINISKSFDDNRLMKFSAVYEVNGELRICYNKKEAWNVYELFHTRFTLHRRAYQHRVSMLVEHMLCEALLLADPYITVTGTNGKLTKLSESPNDMVAYCKISDYIIHLIEYSNTNELEPARNLINRIRKRSFYTFIGELNNNNISCENLLTELIQNNKKLDSKSLLIYKNSINHGTGSKNPVDRVNFFDSRKNYGGNGDNVGTIRKEDVSLVLPICFEEKIIRVYCKDDNLIDEAKVAWKIFRNNCYPK